MVVGSSTVSVNKEDSLSESASEVSVHEDSLSESASEVSVHEDSNPYLEKCISSPDLEQKFYAILATATAGFFAGTVLGLAIGSFARPIGVFPGSRIGGFAGGGIAAFLTDKCYGIPIDPYNKYHYDSSMRVVAKKICELEPDKRTQNQIFYHNKTMEALNEVL